MGTTENRDGQFEFKARGAQGLMHVNEIGGGAGTQRRNRVAQQIIRPA